MKCTISYQCISICMALLCIMSTLSVSINVDKNKERLIENTSTLQNNNVLFVADDITNSFKVNNISIDIKVGAAWNELQQLTVALKSGDKVEFCVSNVNGLRSDSGNPAMFVCQIKYGSNLSVVSDKTWIVNDEASVELGSVSNPTNDAGWKSINYGSIPGSAKLIWNKDKTIRSCFIKILP